MGLHRVVMLVGRQVGGIYLHRRSGKLPGEIATRCRCFGGCLMRLPGCTQVCLVGLLGIVDSDQRACVSRHLKGCGYHQGQGLTAVEHAVVEQGAKRRPLGRVGVTVIVVITGNVRPMAMVQHSDYPGHAHCL
ncbi:hypothetical protein D3C76_729560 [compost metagenome]